MFTIRNNFVKMIIIRRVASKVMPGLAKPSVRQRNAGSNPVPSAVNALIV